MKKEYNTRSKTIIKNIFSENEGKELTSRDVIELTRGNVGEATVYRLLNTLSEDGTVERRLTSDGAVYSYVDHHGDCGCGFHLHCVGCGNVLHLRCETMSGMRHHIIKEHGFVPLVETTVIDGYCDKCKKTNAREVSR
ncbi:MAG: transcriptional repressor [Clostridia bacterium]|nr:transcriptional repressor [Clostridia bacterium]